MARTVESGRPGLNLLANRSGGRLVTRLDVEAGPVKNPMLLRDLYDNDLLAVTRKRIEQGMRGFFR